MPIHLFWGEDEFKLQREVAQLRSHIIDERWQDFNYTEYQPNSLDSIDQAIADISTPPIGSKGRLVYLPSSSLLGATSKEMVQQLESILPNIPATNVLLLTTTTKPDSRNKSVKLLLSHATVKEFPLIPLWLTDALKKLVRALADEIGVAVANDACQLLVESVGNNTRLLFTELEKLKLYTNGRTINADAVKALVLPNATNSLQLATAIRSGNIATALELLENLFNYNEPALKIVATLTTSFRRWFVVKLCVIDGCRDDSAIANLALIKNPKQVYFIKQEVAIVPISRLQKALDILLQLELMLKTGWDERLAMQTQIIKLCV